MTSSKAVGVSIGVALERTVWFPGLRLGRPVLANCPAQPLLATSYKYYTDMLLTQHALPLLYLHSNSVRENTLHLIATSQFNTRHCSVPMSLICTRKAQMKITVSLGTTYFQSVKGKPWVGFCEFSSLPLDPRWLI